MLKSPLEAERNAAVTLDYLIYNCGAHLTKNVQNKQSAFIVALLDGLQVAENAAAVTTLHLDEWVTTLRTQQTAFEALVSRRIAEKLELQNSPCASNLRNTLFCSINAYLDWVHGMAVTSGVASWAQLETELNTRYLAAKAALAGGGSGSTGTDTPGEVEGDSVTTNEGSTNGPTA